MKIILYEIVFRVLGFTEEINIQILNILLCFTTLTNELKITFAYTYIIIFFLE